MFIWSYMQLKFQRCWIFTIRVENGRDKSHSVPPRFLYFTRPFLYYQTNTESVQNSRYQIRKRDGNGLSCTPIVSVFCRDIPFLLIRYIPFLLLCVCGCGYEFVISSIQMWAHKLRLYTALLCVCL